MNKDGLDDVFIGSSKGTKSALFIQGKTGTFTKSVQPVLDNDSTYEDVDACWVDVNVFWRNQEVNIYSHSLYKQLADVCAVSVNIYNLQKSGCR